jgi:hypothetical protein
VRGLTGQVPAFAVLVDIDAEDTQRLAAMRAHYEPAVAFVLATCSPTAIEKLRDAGWLCVGVQASKDIAAAWTQVNQERGVSHGPQ